MEKSTRIKTKAIRTVLIAGTAIMLLKFVAFFLTRSNSILSDALESIINVVAGAFAYYSLWLAAKPKDIDHPYGHGKIEFISAGFEGGLILLTGIIIIGKSVINIFHPVEIHQLNIGVVIAGVAGFANFFLGRYLIKTGEQHHSVTLVADGKHLMSDTYSSIGLVAGVLVIYFTNLLWLDNLFAIVFGIIIIYTGYRLIRKSLSGLMDEANEEIIAEMVEVLNNNRQPNWIDVHNLRILQYGSSFHIDCHITLPWYHDLLTSHDELKKVEKLLTEKFHKKVELFIHPDPCLPFSCSICQLSNCAQRQHPFKQMIPWTVDNVVLNQKHHL